MIIGLNVGQACPPPGWQEEVLVPGLPGVCVAATAVVGMSRHVAVTAPIAILRRRDDEGRKIGFLLDHGSMCDVHGELARGVCFTHRDPRPVPARHFLQIAGSHKPPRLGILEWTGRVVEG